LPLWSATLNLYCYAIYTVKLSSCTYCNPSAIPVCIAVLFLHTLLFTFITLLYSNTAFLLCPPFCQYLHLVTVMSQNDPFPYVKFLCHSSTQQGGWMTVGWNIQLLFHIEMKSMFLSWSKECFQTTANWWYQCWCNLHTASQSMGQTAVLQQQNLWLWHRSTFFLFHRCLNFENALFSPFSVRHRWKTVV